MKLVNQRFEREIDKEKHRYEEKLEEQQRRHSNEIKQLKEQLKIEQDEWRDSLMKKN